MAKSEDEGSVGRDDPHAAPGSGDGDAGPAGASAARGFADLIRDGFVRSRPETEARDPVTRPRADARDPVTRAQETARRQDAAEIQRLESMLRSLQKRVLRLEMSRPLAEELDAAEPDAQPPAPRSAERSPGADDRGSRRPASEPLATAPVAPARQPRDTAPPPPRGPLRTAALDGQLDVCLTAPRRLWPDPDEERPAEESATASAALDPVGTSAESGGRRPELAGAAVGDAGPVARTGARYPREGALLASGRRRTGLH